MLPCYHHLLVVTLVVELVDVVHQLIAKVDHIVNCDPDSYMRAHVDGRGSQVQGGG